MTTKSEPTHHKITTPPGDSTPESAARLQAIIRTVVDGIVTIDARGVIESVNPALEHIFGYTSKELVGKSINKLMPAPFSTHHDGQIQRYLHTGAAHIIGIGREVSGLRKDGSVFPMDLAVSEWMLGDQRMFTGVIRDITERKRAEEAIASVTEEERRRFGRELHDGLGQQFTGVALLAKALQNKLEKTGHPSAEEAGDIAKLAGQTLVDLKRQAHGLYPVELERNGLTAALAELASNQGDLFRVSCVLDVTGQIPALEKSVALHLYRIAQEAVHNGIKHGKAAVISIRLSHENRIMSLMIEDNGVGLPPAAKRGNGMGLIIMKHRASAIGGSIEFDAGLNGGTMVRVLWKPRRREHTELERYEK